MTMTAKTALILGASRGLGYAVAKRLAAQGYHVIAVARTLGGLEELADEIDAVGGQVTLAPMDITDDAKLQQLFRSIYDRWGKLDLLINSAAHAAPLSPVNHVSDKDFDRCWLTNARAVKKVIEYAEPLLKLAKGHAVFIEDTTRTTQFFSAYGASKTAGTEIAKSFREETKNLGITVQIFAPSPMPTALRARFYPGENRETLTSPDAESARLLANL